MFTRNLDEDDSRVATFRDRRGLLYVFGYYQLELRTMKCEMKKQRKEDESQPSSMASAH